MTDPNQQIERSVDSLQKLYAIVIALAVGQAMKSLLLDQQSGTMLTWTEMGRRLPDFLALMAIVVPFFQGMNRHLDHCYVDAIQPPRAGLLLDFLAFFFESAGFFAVAASIGFGNRPFIFLGLLLIFDSVWAFAAHLIHYRHVDKKIWVWSALNIATVAAGLFVVLSNWYTLENGRWLMLVLAIFRTILDYVILRDFYFPIPVVGFHGHGDKTV